MDHEPLAPELDERQRAQALEGRLRRLAREQRAEQRERDPAQDRGGVERLAGRAVEAVEPQLGELLGDGRQHRVLGRIGPLAHRRGRELQRQRMAAHEAVDPLGLRLVEPGAAQHLGRVGGRERAERDRLQQLAERRPPRRARRVARGDHDPRVGRQRGQEGQPQPAVEQPQPLGVVDHEQERRARVELPHRGEERVRRGLDLAAVDRDDGGAARAGLGAKGTEQRRLAGAGDPVDDDHRRRVVEQPGQLGVAADHRRAALGQ